MKHGSAQTPTSTGHRGSSDHRLALGHQGAPASKGKCPQDTESRAPPPSLGHPAKIHYGASPPRRGSPLPPYKVSAPLHTKSEGRRRECFACLGKTFLKLALSRTKPIQVHKA